MTKAETFVPDGVDVETALKRTTHLAISAHQDDIEIMAYDGILKCFGKQDNWFTGVVVTNGSGSPRSGLYAEYTDEEMMQIRKSEQKKAAFIGAYSAQLLLDYPSSAVKSPTNADVKEELKRIIGRLINNKPLEPKHRDHELTGEYYPCRECHIQNDILLVYELDKNNSLITFAKIGTHSELF